MTKESSRLSRQWIYTALILVVGGLVIFINQRSKTRERENKVHLELKAVEAPGGWGYLILQDGQVFIRQTIIPAIPGAHPFHTREDALAIGQKVLDRLSTGQMPVITVADLKAVGIQADSSAHDSVQRK